MTLFTIRVELHAAIAADYKRLHEKLAEVGITDIITDDPGVRYKMPPGEYNYQGTATANEVRVAVENAANQTNRSWAVIVTEVASRTWNGLPYA